MSLTFHQANPTHQCINVLQVFDWVNRSVQIKVNETIGLNKELLKDHICCTFRSPCNGTKTTVWTNVGITNIQGELSIRSCNGCDVEMTIFINGKKSGVIKEGQIVCRSFNHLESIEVVCLSKLKDQVCVGELKLQVKYVPNDKDFHIDYAKCFVSDEKACPVHSSVAISCQEISAEYNRENIVVLLPNGQKKKLQKVDVLLNGYMTVVFFNRNHEIIRTCTFPFSAVETFHVCAPNGTIIQCEGIIKQCNLEFVPRTCKDKEWVDIQIMVDLCFNVESVSEVNLSILGYESHSREEWKQHITCWNATN